jgi:hypothetical protein
MFNAKPPHRSSEQLTQLVYELLDAHEDTARLVEEMASERTWDFHLDYLRALQRAGREVLGQAGGGSPGMTIAALTGDALTLALPAGQTVMHDASDIPPGTTIAEFCRWRPVKHRAKRVRRLLCRLVARAARTRRRAVESRR